MHNRASVAPLSRVDINTCPGKGTTSLAGVGRIVNRFSKSRAVIIFNAHTTARPNLSFKWINYELHESTNEEWNDER